MQGGLTELNRGIENETDKKESRIYRVHSL